MRSNLQERLDFVRERHKNKQRRTLKANEQDDIENRYSTTLFQECKTKQ